MPPIVFRSLRVTLLTLLLAAGACDPTPQFGPRDPSVPGDIYEEQTVTTTAEGAVATLNHGDVVVTFPPTVLPPGTTVTVRVLVNVHKTLDGVEPAILSLWGREMAVQIAPETLQLADTAGIEIHRVTAVHEGKSAQLLFAKVDDPAWTRRGPATVRPADYKAIMAVDRAGTWTLVFDAPERRDAGND